MVQINFAGKEIMTKVVYYGPALCGKTTNLQKLHQISDPDGETKLFSINTDKDRTLFFDLLPLNIGKVHGYNIKLQVFTVPGQVHYSSTRRAVLSGADAIVFVADSQADMMDANIESLRDLGINLELNGLDTENMPMVLQYNKRDMSDLSSITDMEGQLNDSGRKSFEASALNGQGVLDTFIAVAREMMTQIVDKYRLNRGNRNVDITGQLVKALETFYDTNIEDTNPVDMRKLLLTFEQPPSRRVPDWTGGEDTSGEETLPGAMSNNELIERAVSANMELANIYVQLDESKKKVETKVKQLQSVTRIGEAITSILDLEKLMNSVGKQLGAHKGDAICISLVEGRPLDLKPRTSFQLKTDPVFQVRADKGKTLAHLLAHQRRPMIVNPLSNPKWFDLIHTKFSSIQGVLSIPLVSHRRLLGLINILTTDSQRDFDEEDIQFYGATAKFLSSAIENARLYGMVSVLNRNLETKMEEIRHLNDEVGQSIQLKTIELTQANEALRKANAMLQKRNEDKQSVFQHIFKVLPASLILAHDYFGKDVDERSNDSLETSVYKYLMVCLKSYLQIQEDPAQVKPRLMDISKSMVQVIRLHKSVLREKEIRVLTRLDKTLPFQTDPKIVRLVFSLVFLFSMASSNKKSELRIWGEANKSFLGISIRTRCRKKKAINIQVNFKQELDTNNPEIGAMVFSLAKTMLALSGGDMTLECSKVPDNDKDLFIISKFIFSRK